MNRMASLLSLTLILFVLFGCNNSNSSTKADLSNVADHDLDQTDSIKAKKTLSSYKEISEIHALNTKEKLFVAFDVLHRDRFSMEEIESRARNDLKEMFPDKEIEVSTDKKLVIEAEKSERRLIDHKTKSLDKINKDINRLFKLAHKKT